MSTFRKVGVGWEYLINMTRGCEDVQSALLKSFDIKVWVESNVLLKS